MSVMASAAAWGLGEWDRMKEYAGSIPKGTMDCSFYHALLNIHDKKFDKAQEVCVDIPSLLPLSFPPPSLLPSSLSPSLLSSIYTSLHLPLTLHPSPSSQCISDARDILDTELTALVGESYNRAYSVMVSTQLLSELEEIIQCVAIPEKKQVLQQSWWDRLLVSYTCGVCGGICAGVHVLYSFAHYPTQPWVIVYGATWGNVLLIRYSLPYPIIKHKFAWCYLIMESKCNGWYM